MTGGSNDYLLGVMDSWSVSEGTQGALSGYFDIMLSESLVLTQLKWHYPSSSEEWKHPTSEWKLNLNWRPVCKLDVEKWQQISIWLCYKMRQRGTVTFNWTTKLRSLAKGQPLKLAPYTKRDKHRNVIIDVTIYYSVTDWLQEKVCSTIHVLFVLWTGANVNVKYQE